MVSKLKGKHKLEYMVDDRYLFTLKLLEKFYEKPKDEQTLNSVIISVTL